MSALGHSTLGRVSEFRLAGSPAPNRGICGLGSALHCSLTVALHQICSSVHLWPLPQMRLARGHQQLRFCQSSVLPQHSTMLGMCLKSTAARLKALFAGAQDHTATQKVCRAAGDALPEASKALTADTVTPWVHRPVSTTASSWIHCRLKH